jgi:hypothetical protein
MNEKNAFIHNEYDAYIHPHVYLWVYMYNIHFVIIFLGFTYMCIREKAFYHIKFQL